MPGTSELYRPNAAIIYQRADGRVLLCERVKPAGAWQFPQGGIKKGESAMDAACREGMEETGFRPNEYEVVAARGPLQKWMMRSSKRTPGTVWIWLKGKAWRYEEKGITANAKAHRYP